MTTNNRTKKEFEMNQIDEIKVTRVTKSISFHRDVEVCPTIEQTGTLEITRESMEKLILERVEKLNKNVDEPHPVEEFKGLIYVPIEIPDEWKLTDEDFNSFSPYSIRLQEEWVDWSDIRSGYVDEDDDVIEDIEDCNYKNELTIEIIKHLKSSKDDVTRKFSKKIVNMWMEVQ